MDKMDPILKAKLEDKIRQACLLKFNIFLSQSWNTYEPKKFRNSWHLDCICEHLEAQANGNKELRKIILNVPPRHSKTLVGSVAYPGWLWLKNPAEQILTISSRQELATDINVRTRDLIRSKWYRYWTDQPGKPYSFTIREDMDTKGKFKNTKGGVKQAMTISGKIFGANADTIILDDPNDVKDRFSEVKYSAVINAYKSSIKSRQNDVSTCKWLVIQQRLGLTDLTQYLLDNEDGWFHLVLPAEYNKSWTFISPIGFNDKRTEEGQILCDRFPKEYFDEIKKDPFEWNTLYQQKPIISEGNLLKQKDLKFYNVAIPEYKFHQIIFSCDTAGMAEEGKTSSSIIDYSAILKLGYIDEKIYVLDIYRDKLLFPDLLNFMKELAKEGYLFVIENKSTGSPIGEMLKNELVRVELITPLNKSKKERFYYAIVSAFQKGKVYFPSSRLNPKVHELVDELLQFPLSKHDDFVDAISQGIHYLMEAGSVLKVPKEKTPAYSFRDGGFDSGINPSALFKVEHGKWFDL